MTDDSDTMPLSAMGWLGRVMAMRQEEEVPPEQPLPVGTGENLNVLVTFSRRRRAPLPVAPPDTFKEIPWGSAPAVPETPEDS